MQDFVIIFNNNGGKNIYAKIRGERAKISVRLMTFIKECRHYGAQMTVTLVEARNFQKR
ncbi:MAG: hypothetical protein IJ759_00165 [Bacteroidales bacterium]|nr:hypothetical protein [Bacteroidales bacterium]